MRLQSEPSTLQGRVRIPGSKSHTVRGVILATLAEGESVLHQPLESGDTRSALAAARGLGAELAAETPALWRIRGVGPAPRAHGQTIDVGNSGTTLLIALGAAALSRTGNIRFDGDAQIRKRSAGNLLRALETLGARPRAEGPDGCCPIVVRGTLRGGAVSIECPTSQYLTSLLINTPLAEGETAIRVPLLYEQPYVHMTLQWLRDLGLRVEHVDDLSAFSVPGGQRVPAFEKAIPADFSSATFFLCAAALTGSELLLEGLDMDDAQGDKAVVHYLRAMGATIAVEDDGLRVHSGTELCGADLDLNATPDALPAMAVTAACARGTTRLGNVPQARLKETDRIALMARELGRLGVRVRERDDGLEIEGGGLDSGAVSGHGDHRLVMAFAVAGLGARGPVVVDTAEAAAVTFPDFTELLQSVGGRVRMKP